MAKFIVLNINNPTQEEIEFIKVKLNNPKKRVGLSLYRGVSWFMGRNKWISKFQINNKVYNLGYFDLEIEAAKIYNQKAKELLGDKAKLNIL